MHDKQKKWADRPHGASTKWVNVSFMITVLLFSFIIILENQHLHNRVDSAVESQQTLLACNDAARVFRKESDDLTSYINAYLEQPLAETAQSYYAIIDERLREQEIEKAESYGVDCTDLREALALSDALAEHETHAFALVALANDAMWQLPEHVKQYELPAGEYGLSSAEKLAMARQMVCGKEYNDYKRAIYEKVDDFEETVLTATREILEEQNGQISHYLGIQRILIMLENIVVMIFVITLYVHVTSVLGVYIQSISRNELIEEKGTRELKYLGQVFNECLKLQRDAQQALRNEAEQDGLTQVANRRTLENFMAKKLSKPDTRGAFVFLDVDEFKKINDVYGHDAGDTVLRALADALRGCFRDRDFVGRFGGDEFVVWLDGVTEQNADLIKRRIADLNGLTVSTAGTEIHVCLSAGATFCHGGEHYKDVLLRADAALYAKKRGGKQGCIVYEELMQAQLESKNAEL